MMMDYQDFFRVVPLANEIFRNYQELADNLSETNIGHFYTGRAYSFANEIGEMIEREICGDHLGILCQAIEDREEIVYHQHYYSYSLPALYNAIISHDVAGSLERLDMD